MPEVVTLDVLDSDAGELRAQIVRLENRVRMLLAIVRLLFCVFRISGVRLDGDRVPSGEGKTKLLSAIQHARTSLKLTVVLRLIGLSPSRHYAWTKRQTECVLDDRSSCPRSSPGQVTATEIRSMHDMAMATWWTIGPRNRSRAWLSRVAAADSHVNGRCSQVPDSLRFLAGLRTAALSPPGSGGHRSAECEGPSNALPFSCKPAAESALRFYMMSLRRD
jgi:hypothetical protein